MVVRFVFSVEKLPYAGVVPYWTCAVALVLVVQVMIALLGRGVTVQIADNQRTAMGHDAGRTVQAAGEHRASAVPVEFFDGAAVGHIEVARAVKGQTYRAEQDGAVPGVRDEKRRCAVGGELLNRTEFVGATVEVRRIEVARIVKRQACRSVQNGAIPGVREEKRVCAVGGELLDGAEFVGATDGVRHIEVPQIVKRQAEGEVQDGTVPGVGEQKARVCRWW